MIITDLDGTLLNSESELSIINKETLVELGRKGFVRVIATGRVLYSANKVLDENFPIDYLIFSSGSGVINFKTKELINSSELEFSEIDFLVKELDKLELDYMFHAPVPDNHFCLYSIKSNSSDLNKRLGLYKDFSKPWTCSKETLRCWKNKGSILVISCEKEQSESVYIKLCCDFPKLKIIRCTSPISADYCWIEVIPTSTSKAEAAKWLKAFLNFNGETMGIGNDFNDLDLLQWTDKSYVVGNAPESMRNDFNVVCENNSDGFSDAVSDFLIGKDRS